MSDTAQMHLDRLRTGILNTFGVHNICQYISEKTRIKGRKFSFEDHEYQEAILNDESTEKVVKKPSQVGISELIVRLALAHVNVIQDYTIAYTLPTSNFASLFVKTRVDPVIDESPVIKDALNKSVDNTDVKGFGRSYIHFRGCAANNAAISIPVDHLIHDEVDFSDQEILSQYESRITHSPYKRKHKFSTPTVPGFGISEEFMNSRRHFNFVKCHHCNHFFFPDYYKHVRVPGYDNDLREIRKHHLHKILWQSSKLYCPKCGKEPSLLPEHRHMVVENSEANLVAAGFQITPFDAPKIITVPSLVKSSTNYERVQDFMNFGLGLEMEDKDSSFSKEELEALFMYVDQAASSYVIGADQGSTCHIMVAAVTPIGLLYVHAEKVTIGKFKERLKKLELEWNASVTVSDSQPNTETIISLQADMENLYGAVYVRSKSVELFNTKEREETDGKELLKQININRDKAFDAYMSEIRAGGIAYKAMEEKDDIVQHHLDMKRIKIFDDSNEPVYTWQKSKLGVDHYHHAALYAFIAARLKGTAKVGSPSSFRVSTFRTPEVLLDNYEMFWRKKDPRDIRRR